MSIYLKAIKWKEWKEKNICIYIIIKHGEGDEDTDGGTYLILFISKYHHVKFLCIFLIVITNAF